ncbi:UPF0271 protein [Alicyclobacillus cellulosilyticus]|uniref:5-oxoprolinase subunit A n=1 Tax=Alicyclobacillus cellulosilyticus TaxID=1003997 RepID=A0A917NJY5_9BACL|nr:5-oxoprolinase subunit PxpA [Alicyclobacillus cellulosilyticus]GGJ06773.1 UPF0271 protein [Alicyclobacillus cellulosilyticus]
MYGEHVNGRRTIDLNADVGEGFGRYRVGDDAALIPWVTSVNIACGMHAGDPETMLATVRLAKRYGTRIGAHPGLPDLVGFGRREMRVTPREVYALVVYQIGALCAFCRAEGARLHHVKPHGALYNMAAAHAELARAIAEAVRDTDPDLVLVGLAGSHLISEGEKLGLRTMSEVFADRRYRPDGTLVPRHHPDAVLTDEETAIRQVAEMIRSGRPPGWDAASAAAAATPAPWRAETVCVHGDHPQAAAFARKLRARLEEAGIRVAPWS